MRNYWAQQRLLQETDGAGMVFSIRKRFTVAEINAGATLIPAKPGVSYRMIDMKMTAIGGNAATATDVRILGTQSAASVALMIGPVASLTQNTRFAGVTATTNVLAGGLSYAKNDAGSAITVGKTGGTLGTATHVDIEVTFAAEFK